VGIDGPEIRAKLEAAALQRSVAGAECHVRDGEKRKVFSEGRDVVRMGFVAHVRPALDDISAHVLYDSGATLVVSLRETRNLPSPPDNSAPR
jgi:hypothetical protein